MNILNTLAFYIFSILTLAFIILIIVQAKKIAKVELNKWQIVIICLAIIASTIIYSILIFTRKYIYIWDTSIYYLNQLHLLEKFHISFWTGIKSIISTTYREDYGDFLLSFTSGIFSLTNKTEDAFVMTYFTIGTVPIIIIFSMIAKKIIDMIKDPSNNEKNTQALLKFQKILALISSILVIILFPLLHKSAIYGQPDLIGLIFAGIIILITIDYDFTYKDIKRLIYIICCAFCLMITRRWYVFWVFSYFIVYAILVIIKALIKNDNKKKETLLALLKFGISATIVLGILISPIIYRTISNGYQNSYNAWLEGGFLGEIVSQFQRLGILYLAIMIIGIIYGCINNKIRYFTIQILTTWLLSILIFTRIQNMGDHQSLILVPTYLILLFLGINGLSDFAIILLDKITLNKKRKAIDEKFVKISNIIVIAIANLLIDSIVILNFAGSVTYNKYIYNNNWFTSTDLKASNREDIDNIKKMTDFILANCDITDKAYINAGSSDYNNTTFTNVYLPKHIELDGMLPYSFSIDAVHGFPVDVAKCKYVFTTNIKVDDNDNDEDNIIPIINFAIMQDEIICKKFVKVAAFKMNDKVTFYAYQRIQNFDEAEREEWLELFSELSNKYSRLYAEKILAIE